MKLTGQMNTPSERNTRPVKKMSQKVTKRPKALRLVGMVADYMHVCFSEYEENLLHVQYFCTILYKTCEHKYNMLTMRCKVSQKKKRKKIQVRWIIMRSNIMSVYVIGP